MKFEQYQLFGFSLECLLRAFFVEATTCWSVDDPRYRCWEQKSCTYLWLVDSITV